MKKLIAVFAIAIGVRSGSAPTTPTAPTTTPPTQTTFTLSGTVRPTTGAAISGATVRISDGVNAGRSATDEWHGAYSITGLQTSGFTVDANVAISYLRVGLSR
jgi:hypothetical protein